MQRLTQDIDHKPGGFLEAARFWESRRLWHNAILAIVVLLWLGLTWPHFRPALTLVALGKMIVLALLANVCYSAAYVVEFFVQGLLPQNLWRRFRWGVLILGVLLSLVVENYWIADEIYPDVQSGGGQMISGITASNMNFPAPLAVVGFLAACGGVVLCLGAVFIFWFARKPKFARIAGVTVGILALVYLALVVGFSAGSHDVALARGQEKYFCEIDCHLAYSVVDVRMKPAAGWTDYSVVVRTRFDETTISPNRPKDAPLMPSPRQVWVIDASGREYAPSSLGGTPLLTPLKPGESYTTELEFRLPQAASGTRLLLSTTTAWPDHLVIGDENSLLHKKTYFVLEPAKTMVRASNS